MLWFTCRISKNSDFVNSDDLAKNQSATKSIENDTPPQTNISPEKWWLEDEFLSTFIFFSGQWHLFIFGDVPPKSPTPCLAPKDESSTLTRLATTTPLRGSRWRRSGGSELRPAGGGRGSCGGRWRRWSLLENFMVTEQFLWLLNCLFWP